MTPVTTGITSETHIEIKEGLDAGKEVVSGSYKTLNQMLHDGVGVKVQNIEGPAGGGK